MQADIFGATSTDITLSPILSSKRKLDKMITAPAISMKNKLRIVYKNSLKI